MERAETIFFMGSNGSKEDVGLLHKYYSDTDLILATIAYWPTNQFEDREHFNTKGHFQYYLKTEREVNDFVCLVITQRDSMTSDGSTWGGSDVRPLI